MVVRPSKTGDDGAPRGAKAAYSPPALTLYGSVRELTASGSGTGTDGGSVGHNMVSDRAAKENIVRVGEHPLGFGIYLFDYRQPFAQRLGLGRQFGVMADEVAKVVPAAVTIANDGYARVDYAAIGVVQH